MILRGGIAPLRHGDTEESGNFLGLGYVEETDVYFLQYGVNFLDQESNLLLIGGAIYGRAREGKSEQLEDLRLIARGALFNPEEYAVLRPNGRVFLDAHYIVNTVGGLYGRLDPERALRLLKKYLVTLEVGESSLGCNS